MPILINDNTARVQYTATSGQTVFVVPFEFFSNDDLKVYNGSTLLTFNTSPANGLQYSVIGAGVTGGGSITLGSGGAAAGNIITISRDIAVQRTTDFPTAGPFNINALNSELDRIIAVQQNLETELENRVLRLSDSDTPTTLNTLPSAANRALKLLSFDSAGNPVASAPVDGSAASLAASLSASSGSSLVVYGPSSLAGAAARTIEARLLDYVSVKDFGAVGNDSANDTAAFVAAAATGKCVIIPEGIYRVSGVLFNDRVIFLGNAQIRRTSGTLAFAGGIEAPVEQIFLDSVGTAQVDVNNDLTPEGWVDWFGYDANAIETAMAVFKVINMGARDYFADRTVILNQNYRYLRGAWGSAEGLGGTRIVQTSGAPVNAPIIQVGTLNTAPGDIPGNVTRRLRIEGINTIRSNAVNPPSSSDRQDGAPGWLLAGLYESYIHECFDYNSAVSWRIYGCCAVELKRCGSVRPNGGNVNGFPDYYTAFAVGGYSTSFGFIGANASLTLTDCSCAGATGAARVGIYLFGYIGDTWIDKFENSQVEYGIYVDGSDSAGTTITSTTAHRDVRISNCVLDNLSTSGIVLRNINTGGGIQLTHNYIAIGGAGKGIEIDSCYGNTVVHGGDMVANSTLTNFGLWIIDSERVHIDGLMICDFYRGAQLENIYQCHIAPVIQRQATGGNEAIYASAVNRSIVSPIIDGVASSWTYGINATDACLHNDFNLTKINYGSFTTVSATFKLWYDGATWGGGTTFGTGNVASGALG